MKTTAYLLQATLVLLWWIGLLINPSFYDAFQFPGIGNDAFNSFILPDITVIALLSIIRAYKPIKELDYFIAGGFAFATLYCINASFLTGGGFLATTLMTLGLFFNLFLINQSSSFRTSKSNNLMVNSLKTAVQIICVWTITLYIIPTIIMSSFNEPIEIENLNVILAVILFTLSSAIGLYSAFSMVKVGKGTPFPLDQTQELVVVGPYKFIRNPMAFAGVGQGIAVSILYRSYPIFFYILIGAILWHFVVRPIEETDMIQRFGEAYKTYQKKVNCWIPKLNS